MNLESLQKGDIIYITNIRGEQHTADFLEFTHEGVYINFKGFGHLEVKWADMLSIQHITKAAKVNDSFGPRYKVTLWQAQ